MLNNTQSAPSSADQSQSLDELLALCKASADPLRLQILRLLKSNSFGVLELCAIFDSKQSSMSHHLKVLAKAGLVTTRREGNSIFYRRTLADNHSGLEQVHSALLVNLDSQALSPELGERVQDTQSQRSASSREFFSKHSDLFREQQELIADYSQYADSARDLLRKQALPSSACVLEIGPGEGAFLAELSPHFSHVHALDNSLEMLTKAQAFACDAGLDNVSFIHGETTEALEQGLQVDAIVMNMVLHHVSAPEELLHQASQLLKPGGVLLITDLCEHDQDWVREACGDLWLGFAPDDLKLWAQACGLNAGDSLYLGLRNGFQIQQRCFYKNAALNTLPAANTPPTTDH